MSKGTTATAQGHAPFLGEKYNLLIHDRPVRGVK